MTVLYYMKRPQISSNYLDKDYVKRTWDPV